MTRQTDREANSGRGRWGLRRYRRGQGAGRDARRRARRAERRLHAQHRSAAGAGGSILAPEDLLARTRGFLTNGRVVRDRALSVEPAPGGDRVGRGDPGRLRRFGHRVEISISGQDGPHRHPPRSGAGPPSARGARTGRSGPPGRRRPGRHRAGRRDPCTCGRRSRSSCSTSPTRFSAGRTSPSCKAELRRQLLETRVELILGSPLRQPPPTEPGELETFTVITEAGTEIAADIWFRCYGVVPNSDYLGRRTGSRSPLGRVRRGRPHAPGRRTDNGLRSWGRLYRRRQDGRLRRTPSGHRGARTSLP